MAALGQGGEEVVALVVEREHVGTFVHQRLEQNGAIGSEHNSFTHREHSEGILWLSSKQYDVFKYEYRFNKATNEEDC